MPGFPPSGKFRRGKTRNLAGGLRTGPGAATGRPPRPGDGLTAVAPRAPPSPGRRPSPGPRGPRRHPGADGPLGSRARDGPVGVRIGPPVAVPSPQAREPDRRDLLPPGPGSAGPLRGPPRRRDRVTARSPAEPGSLHAEGASATGVSRAGSVRPDGAGGRAVGPGRCAPDPAPRSRSPRRGPGSPRPRQRRAGPLNASRNVLLDPLQAFARDHEGGRNSWGGCAQTVPAAGRGSDISSDRPGDAPLAEAAGRRPSGSSSAPRRPLGSGAHPRWRLRRRLH